MVEWTDKHIRQLDKATNGHFCVYKTHKKQWMVQQKDKQNCLWRWKDALLHFDVKYGPIHSECVLPRSTDSRPNRQTLGRPSSRSEDASKNGSTAASSETRFLMKHICVAIGDHVRDLALLISPCNLNTLSPPNAHIRPSTNSKMLSPLEPLGQQGSISLAPRPLFPSSC